MPQYATGGGCDYRIQKANQPRTGAFMRCDSQNPDKIHFRFDFLGPHPHSRLIRRVMVLSLLFNGIPQKTVASITNHTDMMDYPEALKPS